jgi:hypothetical protein
MSRKKQNPITSDKLKDVIATYSLNLSASMPKPAVCPTVMPGPLKPAELDQDAGGGYNANRTFPQT